MIVERSKHAFMHIFQRFWLGWLLSGGCVYVGYSVDDVDARIVEIFNEKVWLLLKEISFQ